MEKETKEDKMPISKKITLLILFIVCFSIFIYLYSISPFLIFLLLLAAVFYYAIAKVVYKIFISIFLSIKFKTLLFIFLMIIIIISLVIVALYYEPKKDFEKYCEKRSDKVYYCKGWGYNEQRIKNNIEKYCNLLNLNFRYACAPSWACPSDQFHCSEK